MRLDVLAGDVRNEFLKPVSIPIQDQASLRPMPPRSELFGPEKESKLQRHLEPRQLVLPIELRPGNIVNAERRGTDQPIDFLKPHLAGVVMFQRAAGNESAYGNGEYDGPEDGQVLPVKGTIDKYAARVLGGTPFQQGTRRITVFSCFFNHAS